VRETKLVEECVAQKASLAQECGQRGHLLKSVDQVRWADLLKQ
jgi:hypothetical protein